MTKQIFKKEYDSEMLSDIERDISECFDSDFNPEMKNIKQDEHGFHKGVFTVTVEWREEQAKHRCFNCGSEIEFNTSYKLLSAPLRYEGRCKKCGNNNYIKCSEID